MRNNPGSLPPSIGQRVLVPPTSQIPGFMSENVFPLPGVGMDLYPSLESPYADNLAKFNKVVDRLLHGGADLRGAAFQELAHSTRRLGAPTDPIVNTFLVDAKFFFVADSPGIEKTHPFNETAPRRAALVCHHDRIKRLLFCTTAC
jgi:hypothetical protein